MENKNWRIEGELINTDKIMYNTLWLGVFPGLREEHLEYVCTELELFFGVGF